MQAKGTNLSILEILAASTRRRVDAAKAERPLSRLLNEIPKSRTPHAFTEALTKVPTAVIAEIKRASPSRGWIAENADPVQVAGEYLKAGAAAISVLTEPEFFHGKLAYLDAIRAAYPQSRLLLKDFVLDEYQCAEARLHGADAVLLIASLLSERELPRLHVFARTLGLTPLVEVHDEAEMRRAAALKATLIGVNHRNLRTLEIDLGTSARLIGDLPRGAVAVAESGIERGLDIQVLKALGYQAFLVGTSLMKGGAPGPALEKLIEGSK